MKWSVVLTFCLMDLCILQTTGDAQTPASTQRPIVRASLGFDDSPAPPDPSARNAPRYLPEHAAPAPQQSAIGEPIVVEAESPWVWFEGDALLWWIKNSRLPALVTTSPQASLGVLGQPDTTVLFGGDVENEERSGGRFRLGIWLDDEMDLGVEADFFFLGERTIRFAAASNGEPLLARPFFNAGLGIEDAEQVADAANPSIPAVIPLTGKVSVSSSSRLWGTEANALHFVGGGPCAGLYLLGGFRYMRLDEALAISEDLRVPLTSPVVPGNHINVVDDFGARNNFYAGQFGARAELARGDWSLELLGKLALGVSDEDIRINGSTLINTPGQPSHAFTGGLLALPSNIGSHGWDRFAVLPEVGVKVGYRLTSSLYAMVGYSFLYWSSVVRPGDQIDRSLNTSQIPPGTLRGSASPAATGRDTDFWAQGVDFGLFYQF